MQLSVRTRLSKIPAFLGSSLLLAALLLFAIPSAPAHAESPFRLDTQLTDRAGVLGGKQASVQSALDKLYNEQHVQLWVVYVKTFGGQSAQDWSTQTVKASDLGTEDVLLAVATDDRSYYLDASADLTALSDSELDTLRQDSIEPALRDDDWAGAATAAAQGMAKAVGGNLTPGGGGGGGGSFAFLLLLIPIAGLVVFGIYYFRKKSKAGAQAAGGGAGPRSPEGEFAQLSTKELDSRVNTLLVESDDALRTSEQELGFAQAEFGADQTAGFSEALANARAALSKAFEVRQVLDDDDPETEAEQRAMLTQVLVSCNEASDALDAQVENFDEMRDLLGRAPERLEALGAEIAAVQQRIVPAGETLQKLGTQFPATALASVADNVAMATERLKFASDNVAAGKAALAQEAEKGSAVVAVRAAEGAIDQATKLLGAVDTAATDIQDAATKLPGAIAEIEGELAKAQQLAAAGGPELTATASSASAALAEAKAAQTSDPLGALTRLVQVDAALDQALNIAEETDARLARAKQALLQDLTAAKSNVTAANDFIETRRGAIGAAARTRLSEAVRHLKYAYEVADKDPSTAVQHAQAATGMSQEALQLAQNDVSGWSTTANNSANSGGGLFGGNGGAILGGILLNSILSGGGGSRGGGSHGGGGMFGGGGGGRSPGSFGGPRTGGRRGGGGRF